MPKMEAKITMPIRVAARNQTSRHFSANFTEITYPKLNSSKIDLRFPDVLRGRQPFVQLDSCAHLSQHFRCCTCQSSWSIWLLASQALASDHVVETTCSRCGHHVRRF